MGVSTMATTMDILPWAKGSGVPSPRRQTLITSRNVTEHLFRILVKTDEKDRNGRSVLMDCDCAMIDCLYDYAQGR